MNINLDELRNTPQKKSGFDTDWPSECGEIHTDESSDRTEDRDHIQQATDHT